MATEVELDPEIYGVSPESARRRLEFMGFEEDMWDKIMKSGFDGDILGSHETRALITMQRAQNPDF